ncbi:MAG: class I lanthipeptide [Bacteroidota bacterium]
MKKSKKIGLSLNKKTISQLHVNQINGGSSGTHDPGSGACGSGGGSTNNTGSWCACK